MLYEVITSFDAGATITVSNYGVRDPNNFNSTNKLNRYWRITPIGINNIQYDFTAAILSSDVVGDLGKITGGSFNVGDNRWEKQTSSTSLTSALISITGLSTETQLTGISSTPVTITITNESPLILCSGESVTLTTSYTGDSPIYYLWQYNPTLNTSNPANPVATPTTTTTYIVTINDYNGFLSNQASITIYVNETPTVITSYSIHYTKLYEIRRYCRESTKK